jgi:hypothetical protein
VDQPVNVIQGSNPQQAAQIGQIGQQVSSNIQLQLEQQRLKMAQAELRARQLQEKARQEESARQFDLSMQADAARLAQEKSLAEQRLAQEKWLAQEQLAQQATLAANADKNADARLAKQMEFQAKQSAEAREDAWQKMVSQIRTLVASSMDAFKQAWQKWRNNEAANAAGQAALALQNATGRRDEAAADIMAVFINRRDAVAASVAVMNKAIEDSTPSFTASLVGKDVQEALKEWRSNVPLYRDRLISPMNHLDEKYFLKDLPVLVAAKEAAAKAARLPSKVAINAFDTALTQVAEMQGINPSEATKAKQVIGELFTAIQEYRLQPEGDADKLMEVVERVKAAKLFLNEEQFAVLRQSLLQRGRDLEAEGTVTAAKGRAERGSLGSILAKIGFTDDNTGENAKALGRVFTEAARIVEEAEALLSVRGAISPGLQAIEKQIKALDSTLATVVDQSGVMGPPSLGPLPSAPSGVDPEKWNTLLGNFSNAVSDVSSSKLRAENAARELEKLDNQGPPVPEHLLALLQEISRMKPPR